MFVFKNLNVYHLQLNENIYQKLYLFIVMSDAEFLARNKDRMAQTFDCKTSLDSLANIVFNKRKRTKQFFDASPLQKN